MKFLKTGLEGAYLVETEPHVDHRGLFARTFCEREFSQQGLTTRFVQCSVSFSHAAGTIRGLHYQIPPVCEVKLVRCTAGALYDVIVDLRPESPTYLKHFGVELNARNRLALYVPGMFAHGHQTLAPETEIFYQISEFHSPESARGLRYNEPKLAIRWPLPVSSISERDRTWPPLG